jgi:hypothetical protein
MVGVPKGSAKTSQRDVPENFYRPDHGRSLNWYVRLVPPTALKGRPGVKEFRKSTGTADLRRAKTVGAHLIAEKRAEWDKLLAAAKPLQAEPQVLTSERVEHICARRLYQWGTTQHAKSSHHRYPRRRKSDCLRQQK